MGAVSMGEPLRLANQSIHPRVVNGRTAHPKSNTCHHAHNPARGTLRKVLKRLHARRHDRDLTVDRITKSPGGLAYPDKAYRAPGSMKP